jgi:hypothetical protein
MRRQSPIASQNVSCQAAPQMARAPVEFEAGPQLGVPHRVGLLYSPSREKNSPSRLAVPVIPTCKGVWRSAVWREGIYLQ